ncbi:MAG: hypothetical protein ABSH28_21020 [Acidobacteriota bacterium]|jgi:hypothetical protein
MRTKAIVVSFAVMLAGSLIASAEQNGQHQNDKFLTITGTETVGMVIDPGTYTFLKSGNTKLRGKISVYNDQYLDYPQFSGESIVTTNCDIGKDGTGHCWGAFWPTNEAGSGNFVGTWEGEFNFLTGNGSYKAVAHGVGPLDGYEARTDASYPAGDLVTKVFLTNDR